MSDLKQLSDKVLHYALELHDVITPPIINLINNYIYTKRSESFQKGTTGDGTVNLNDKIRSVEVLGFSEQNIGTSVSLRVLYNKLRFINNAIAKAYMEEVSPYYLPPREVTFQFLRYTDKMKGHYEFHTDNSYTNPRTTTTIIGLSDPNSYEGGELQIQNNEKLMKLNYGGGVIFPSNFMFPHKVHPVTKGERKVLVIWNR